MLAGVGCYFREGFVPWMVGCGIVLVCCYGVGAGPLFLLLVILALGGVGVLIVNVRLWRMLLPVSFLTLFFVYIFFVLPALFNALT